VSDAMSRLRDIARDPRSYISAWRREHPGAPVLGVLPMNFPRELAYAGGMLPALVFDDQQPIGEGRALLPEFYCGFTRNLADQAATGRLDIYDAVLTADHCIQLVGSTDVVRMLRPETSVFFGMLATSLSDEWALAKVTAKLAEFRMEVERLAGGPVSDEAVRRGIAAYNADREALRRLFDQRAAGSTAWSPTQLQDLVASSMVMDPVEHLTLLHQAIEDQPVPAGRDERVRVHLSGHLCHAPRRELLEVIEDSGATVVDDDLWTGRRYLSTDVDHELDPMDALARWYMERNHTIPCPTRVEHDVNWDTWLVEAARRSGAEAVIHLMPKFCEPHMLFYPELRRALDAAGIPQLLIETEHEGIPLESFRTRLEALVERANRNRPAYA
jgi:benzoyl-CoA reductase subunit C